MRSAHGGELRKGGKYERQREGEQERSSGDTSLGGSNHGGMTVGAQENIARHLTNIAKFLT
jgi:hypothetical protein